MLKYHLVEIKKLCNLETNCLGIVANHDPHTGTNYYLCNSPNGLVEDENFDVHLKKFLLGIIQMNIDLGEPNVNTYNIYYYKNAPKLR